MCQSVGKVFFNNPVFRSQQMTALSVQLQADIRSDNTSDFFPTQLGATVCFTYTSPHLCPLLFQFLNGRSHHSSTPNERSAGHHHRDRSRSPHHSHWDNNSSRDAERRGPPRRPPSPPKPRYQRPQNTNRTKYEHFYTVPGLHGPCCQGHLCIKFESKQ